MTPKEPSNKWIDQNFIITGIPKIGKTSFFAQGQDKTFFIRMASEFNNLKTYGKDCLDINDVESTITKIFKAAKAGILPFETLVFDPGIRVLEYISDQICLENDVESLGEIPHGKGWGEYKKRIKNFTRRLEPLPCAVVFNIHSHTIELPEASDDKKTFTKEIVALSGKTEGPISQWAEHILHIKSGYVGNINARTMILQGNKYIEAGTKSLKLKEVKSIPWSTNDKENFDKFRALFD